MRRKVRKPPIGNKSFVKDAYDVDVLIAGAGPVGLFLANECARRNLRFRIVEARPAQSEYSKALAIFPRTMEVFDMAGVVEPFVAAANRVTWVVMIARDHRLAAIEFDPPETPYSYVAMVPQDVTEKLLAEQLVRRGGAVEYETTLQAAVEYPDFIQATVESRGVTREMRARYVVGCDGAHSTVRHLLNLPFEGAEYRDTFMLADVDTNDALPANEMHLCPNEQGPLAIFPMSVSRRRIIATIDQVDGDAPSLDTIRGVLALRGPAGIEALSLHWSAYFRIHHRQTADMSRGRFFIAGDAAHIHSPVGGQGMNAGLHDAWNLAWKLDLAVRGLASGDLLETYGAERRPVIKGVVETTHVMTQMLSTRNPIARGLRDAVLPIATHLPQIQHAFVNRLSGLGVSYAGSPIVEGSGRRYFDDSLRDGKIASRFLLLLGSDADVSTCEHAQAIAAESATLELRKHAAAGLILLRPDGYVAYEAPHADIASLSTAHSVLARQTAVSS